MQKLTHNHQGVILKRATRKGLCCLLLICVTLSVSFFARQVKAQGVTYEIADLDRLIADDVSNPCEQVTQKSDAPKWCEKRLGAARKFVKENWDAYIVYYRQFRIEQENLRNAIQTFTETGKEIPLALLEKFQLAQEELQIEGKQWEMDRYLYACIRCLNAGKGFHKPADETQNKPFR